MATYIHYERFCSACKRYYEGKLKECPKCNGAVKNVNKWYVTFRAEEFGQNKQKKLGAFTTKSEAELAYMQYSVGDKTPTSSYTFEMLALEVIERHKTENKSSSYLAYRNLLFNRLKPLLKMQVKNINEKTLRAVYNDIKTSTYAPNSKRATWGALGHALYYAYIRKNIDTPYKAYKKFKTFKSPTVKKISWSIEDWKKFNNTLYNLYITEKAKAGDDWLKTEACKHYLFYVFFNYLVNMGNRRGEVLALRVCKINFKNQTVTIDESITFEILPEERIKGMSYSITDRKNHKVLVETMPTKLSEMLQEYISTMKLKPNDFMFFRDAPLSQQMISRALDYYIKLAAVPRITIHQFRHTLASIIFATGSSKIEDAYVVANRLGHDVKYTLDTYGDLYKERECEILENLGL
jgi:integrase